MKTEHVTTQKAHLRKQIRGELAAMEEAARLDSDAALFERLLSLPQLQVVGTVLLFYGVGTEPRTQPLMSQLQEMGKRVLLPRCLPDTQMEAREVGPSSKLVPAPRAFLIPEPGEDCPLVAKKEIDFILVPCLCCDKDGFRLGQGGGYYDRYLENYRGTTVSFCRKALLQDALPREAHDRRVQIIITEDQMLVPT